MQPGHVTLPHSGLNVPHAGYKVTGYKGQNTYDGVAFTATLRHDGKIIGTIDNTGTGGADTFHAHSHDAATAMRAFVQHSTDQLGKPIDEEAVLNALVTEYDTARIIAKAAKRGNVAMRMVEDWESDGEPMGIPNAVVFTETSPTEAAHPQQLRERLLADPQLRPHDLAYWQVWNTDAGQWADVTDRPEHLRQQATTS